MRRRCVRIRSLAVLAVGLLAVSACGGDGASNASSSETTEAASGDVVIRYLQPSSSMAYLPFEIAQSMGLFEEAGVKVEVLPNNGQGSQALLSGEVDVAAVSTPQLFNALAEGRELKAVAVMTPNSTNDLVLTNETIARLADQGITPESPIEDRIGALKGLRITLPAEGSSSNLSLRSVLKEYGLDPDTDVELIALSESSAHVATSREGRADGYMFSPPVTSIAITDGFGQLWFGFYENEIPLMANFSLIQVATTPEFLDTNTEAVAEFVNVLADAVEALRTEPEQVSAALKGEWFPDLDQATFDLAFEAMTAVYDSVVPTEDAFIKTRDLVSLQVGRELALDFDDVYDMRAFAGGNR